VRLDRWYDELPSPPIRSFNEGNTMGNWGSRALQSDEGLDVVDCLREFLAERTDVRMADFLEKLRTEGMLPRPGAAIQIDFLYDKCATATTELFFEFRDKGLLDYDDEDLGQDQFHKLRSLTAEADDLEYLLHLLQDIRAGKPGRHGIREYTELSLTGSRPDEWRAHMDDQIARLTDALNAAKS
jgi:hypothetical protein